MVLDIIFYIILLNVNFIDVILKNNKELHFPCKAERVLIRQKTKRTIKKLKYHNFINDNTRQIKPLICL